ncbi:NETI motif-containing protein [Streptohalobacillus salinus]|uniref:NETI motif-containing protein n=1 Tax=Streptohalobacillus salinus TaxID=621096 RepID=UPI000D775D8A|nr:NETI motif-containing protein [Streptohalobacillus salinus]
MKNQQQKASQTPTRKKERFTKETNESIDACLDRIKAAGYTPVKRMEQPVFEEITENGQITTEVVEQMIIFEAIRIKDEQ